MVKKEDYMNNFTLDDTITLKYIQENKLDSINKSAYRDVILKLNKSLESSVNKINELETTIIQKDIRYENLQNQKTILTCFSILFIFIFIISFIIGFYIGNKKK